MRRADRSHPTPIVGWACSALLCLATSAVAQQHENPAQLLQEADAIKTSDHERFLRELALLDENTRGFTTTQKEFLRYLHAWEDVYAGKYDAAIPQLNSVIDDSADATLRFRAGVTVVNALAISARYQDGYARLNQILDLLPQVSDVHARQQGYGVAALLYNQAGQYDLASVYADKLIEENWSGRGPCVGGQLKLQALYQSGKLQTLDGRFQEGIDACKKIGEFGFANTIRTYVANIQLHEGLTSNALDLLRSNYDDVQKTHYPRLLSEFDSLLARAYWQSKDAAQAQVYALRAIDDGVKNEVTQPLADAYRVLYEVARQQGNFKDALDWHEKYAATDKGYLNDESAHALAYQMVSQQVFAKKAQFEALSKQNQVLQLKQAVSQKSVEARNLTLLLLVTILTSILVYAYRTKRSEVKFMKLARRDGLTDIYNRQYFVEASGQELQYCQKSMRDVSVIVIDLDHFKQINDTHGHAAGDFALKRAVAMCQAHLRSVDVFGRLGGEEFGILMPDCVPERAADQAELMRLSIERLVNSEDGPEFPVRASFGISAARWSGYDLRQLLAHADSALYQAKREGRNRVVVYAGAAANSEPPPGLADRRRTASYSAREDVRR